MADHQLGVTLAHNVACSEIMDEVKADQDGFVFDLIICCLKGEL